MTKYIKFRDKYFHKDEITELSIVQSNQRIKWILTLTYIYPHRNNAGHAFLCKTTDFGYDSNINNIDDLLIKDIMYIENNCIHCNYYDDNTIYIIKKLKDKINNSNRE